MPATLKRDITKCPVPRLEPTKPIRVNLNDAWVNSMKTLPQVDTWEELHERQKKKAKKYNFKQNKSNWTDEQIQTIREMWIAGKPKGEIADALHMPLTKVTNKIEKMRTAMELPPRKPTGGWSDAEISKLIELYAADVPLAQIGQELGRSAGGCSAKMSELIRKGKIKIQKRGAGKHNICRRALRGNGCD